LSKFASGGVYKANEAQLPIKWSAPEVLRNGTYSSKSDVFSFGRLLYELFNGGQIPFKEFTNAEAKERVLNGETLPQPENCPDNIYKLMLSCWNEDPKKRPNIKDVFNSLHEMMGPQASTPSVVATTEASNFYMSGNAIYN
jgi:serine/threonine protein kinase